jgi:hypothetical protein
MQSLHTVDAILTNPFAEFPPLVVDLVDSERFQCGGLLSFLSTDSRVVVEQELCDLVVPSLTISRLNRWVCASFSKLQMAQHSTPSVMFPAVVTPSI